MNEKLTRIGRYQSAWNRTDLEKELIEDDLGDPEKIDALQAIGRKLKSNATLGEIDPNPKK